MQCFNSLLPVHTGVSNAHSINQLVFVLHILPTRLDEALQHQPDNTPVPTLYLSRDILRYRHL